jgi:hypothetical protein
MKKSHNFGKRSRKGFLQQCHIRENDALSRLVILLFKTAVKKDPFVVATFLELLDLIHFFYVLVNEV